MTGRVERVRLPRTAHIDELRGALDGALRVLTVDAGAMIRRRGGADPELWAQTCAQAIGAELRPFSFSDPADVLKLLCKPNEVSSRLGVVGLRAPAERARLIRNRLYHHEMTLDDPLSVAVQLSALQNLAQTLGLQSCRDEIDALRRAVTDLDDSSAHDASSLVPRAADPDDVAALQAALSDAQKQAELLEAREAELLELRDELASQVSTERDRVNELESHRSTDAERIAELGIAITKVNAELVDQQRVVDVAVAVEHLRQVSLDSAMATSPEVKPAVRDDIEMDAQESGTWAVEIGAPWPGPRGRLQLRLVPSPPGLERPDRGELVVPAFRESIREAARAFLTVRPGGGRVWVDDDGDATTYLAGRLTYLGRLPFAGPAAGGEDGAVDRHPTDVVTEVEPGWIVEPGAVSLSIEQVLRRMDHLGARSGRQRGPS